ncbi:MAG: 30S ribosomal protein S24e [Desulfurococcaceae archaeon]
MSKSTAITIAEGYEGGVIEEKYNPLIKRREVIVRVFHSGRGTPSRGLIRQALANAYGVSTNCVYIRRIISEKGMNSTIVEAHVYESSEKAKVFEPEYIIKRNEVS